MKVSLSWLKKYVDIDIPVQELCDRMVMAGFEVEEMINLATINSIAKLPPRDILLATVCNAFNAPISALARALQAIVDKDGEAAPEAAAE